MKTVNSIMLLETLREQTREVILQAEQLKQLPATLLEQKPGQDKWSVAQVLEHLNIYCRYYLDAIEKKLHHNHTVASGDFTPGWLGSYFTRLMQPEKNDIIKKKMKAPAHAQPAAQPATAKMLQEFIQHQHHLLNLLQIAKRHNINSNRIPTSIAKMISLKLGDTFCFVMAHQQRHFGQIQNTIKMVENINTRQASPSHTMAEKSHSLT